MMGLRQQLKVKPAAGEGMAVNAILWGIDSMITSDGEQSAGLHDAAELPQGSAQFMAQLTSIPLAQMAPQRLISCVIYYRCKASLSPCKSMYVRRCGRTCTHVHMRASCEQCASAAA